MQYIEKQKSQTQRECSPNGPSTALIVLIVSLAICASLYSGWEMGGEAWGYWYFARVFAETGQFIVTDRSPLYILYLNIFTQFPYPGSVIAEYVLTTSLVTFSLVYFFRPIVGAWPAILAGCLWIPYLQSAEPPVQKLSLMISLIAITVRSTRSDRASIVYFYTLLSVAALFRQTYLLFLLIFLGFDLLTFLQKNKVRNLINWESKVDWLLLVPPLLYVWFKLCTSNSVWNTVWFTDATWFPGDGKTMAGGAIQAFNMAYILKTYGTYVGHDFYFSNQEAFNGATDMIGAVIANPNLVMDILWANVKALMPTLTMGNWLPQTNNKYVDYLFVCIFLILVLVGALKVMDSGLKRTFILASLALAMVSVVAHPSNRYMMPMIPVFVFAASWVGINIFNTFSRIKLGGESTLFNLSIKKSFKLFIQLVFIIIFSSSQLPSWNRIILNIKDHVFKDRVTAVLTSKNWSINRAYAQLNNLIKDCRGLMAYEANFLGAFTSLPLERIYTPWEIPPFGQFGNSPYSGLSPERIDCLLLSSPFTMTVGGGTNIQIRYQSYIEPYAEQLRQLGAQTHVIPGFGELLRLPGRS